jgi:sulfite oxidase
VENGKPDMNSAEKTEAEGNGPPPAGTAEGGQPDTESGRPDSKEKADGTSDKRRIWTYYRNGVYDITDYIPLHPGGEIVLKAAGECRRFLFPGFSLYFAIPHFRTLLFQFET